MALPVVAIIGRPNVGKSSLFNALAGQMISVVEPTAGVTRDRVSTIIGKDDKFFELIDTGGYGIVDARDLSEQIEYQILQAIDSASLILFMVDIRDGLVPLDETIARLLRTKAQKNQGTEGQKSLEIIGVANKADTAKMFAGAAEFSRLGFGEFMCISATNNINKKVLLDRIFETISEIETPRPKAPIMKIAIVGKQNAGKSTLVNAIVGSNRVIVNQMPGTTRDAVDIRFEKDGKTIVVIDTAGVRKKRSINESIEFYSYVRATHSISRADLIMLIIDATVPISQVDKKLANTISDEFKSCIIVVNKWDLAKDTSATDDYMDYITKMLPGLKYAPIAFTTATQEKNIQSVLDLAAEIFKQATTWMPTAKLNKAFEVLKNDTSPSAKSGTRGRPKIYYATQIAVNPVTLLLFVNKTELFDANYQRFILNRLREMLTIEEVPIRLLIRSHREKKAVEG
jgi:GTPase